MEAEQYVCELLYLHLADVMARAACGVLSASKRPSSTCRSYSGNRIPCWCHPASNLSATDKALPCYRLVLVFGNARSGDWSRSGRRASTCGPLYVPATHRPLHHDSVDGWRSALGTDAACLLCTSWRCSSNNNRELGRARSRPGFILEKQ